jgi:cellulose synthase/poly-beta-1,6-N-acetylglucosamine synthase-like glycosyltransferase
MRLLALAAIALLAYTYVGYPAVIALWARLAPYRIQEREDFEPTISVCMTVFNGGAFIAAKLRSLQLLDYPKSKIEILVCSDSSTDDTDAITREFAASDPRVRLFRGSPRMGKPALVNRLCREASGQVLLMTDVRQPLSPNALRALMRPLADTTVGSVSGSLVLSGSTGAGLYWRYERFIRRAEGRVGQMVGVSGSIYALRRADLPLLPEDLILDDMFVPLMIALSKKRVVLSDAAEAYDHAFEDHREFSRKVRTLAGNYQLLAKAPLLLVPIVNPAWFQMLSHKLSRLLCPWALLALLPASIGLAVWHGAGMSRLEVGLWGTLAVGQTVLYLLAALGARGGPLARVARTFVVLNAAAVVGLWRFLRGHQAVTW